MNRRAVRLIVWLWLCGCLAVAAAEDRKGGGNARANKPKQDSACLDVPAHSCDVVLGRPTRDSVTVSVLCYQDTEGSIAYGTQRGNYPEQTPARQFKQGEPAEVILGSLRPDTQYYLRVKVSPDKATVEYVEASSPGRRQSAESVSHRYSISPR